MSLALEAPEFPLIDSSKIEPRLYQLNLFRSAAKENCLVVLPTGMGKTVVALMMAAKALEARSAEKLRAGPTVVMLAPTKPLVEQHAKFFRESLVGAVDADAAPSRGPIRVAALTGKQAAADREDLWGASDIVVATPQVIRNDLIREHISLKDVEVLVVDEAHRATGDYPYAFIAERFRQSASKTARLLALTASPGKGAREIWAICEALAILQIDVRTEDDPDVKPYVQPTGVNPIEVDLPTDFKIIAAKLRRTFDRETRKLQEAGVIRRGNFVSGRDIIEARKAIQANIARATPATKGMWWQLASVQARAMKINHALEYVETQGLEVFLAYMDRLKDEAAQKGGSAGSKALIRDPDFVEAYGLAKGSKSVHPKVEMAVKLVQRALKSQPNGRVILFAHFRETGEVLLRRFQAVEGISAVRFVGQTTKGDDLGLSQKEQVKLLEDFSAGIYNLLIATSVAEEGLDIPQVDHVIFYEPIPSEIRTIQRRGRTGRRRAGSVEVLVARKTRDEAFVRASQARESTMREELKRLRANARLPIEVLDSPPEVEIKRRLDEIVQASGKNSKEPAPAGTLDQFEVLGPAPVAAPQDLSVSGETIRVVVDDRELRAGIAEKLRAAGVPVDVQRLEVGDYACPPRLGIERKTVTDFASSVVDGRLFRQAEALSAAYERPVMIVEGDPAAGGSSVHPAAVEGAVASLIVDYRIAVVRTPDAAGSAALIASLARKAGAPGASAQAKRHRKSGMTLEEKQRFVLEGLPGVSDAVAKKLLAQFGSIRALSQASLEDIASVAGVGRKTAEQIFDVLRAPYRADAGGP